MMTDADDVKVLFFEDDDGCWKMMINPDKATVEKYRQRTKAEAEKKASSGK